MGYMKKALSLGITLMAASGVVFAEEPEESMEYEENAEHEENSEYEENTEYEAYEGAEADKYIPFFEIIVMGGIAALDVEDSTIKVTHSETDKLVQSNANDWDATTGRLGLGYNYPLHGKFDHDEWVWLPIITPQVNLYFLDGNISGEVYRFEHPDFNQESYNMDFDSTRLMFDLGLTLATYKHLSVYALAGLGISWNDIDFDTTLHDDFDCECEPIPLTLEPEDGCASFVYEFGAGLNYAATDYLTFSLEYLFTAFTDVGVGGSAEDSELLFGGTQMDIDSQALLLGLRVAL